MPELLRVDDLRAGYGSAAVLHGVELSVAEAELVVLLGANGVGKTTTLSAIAGIVRPWSGRVALHGRPIDRLSTEQIIRLGLGMVPAPPGIFRELSVADNLRAGATASRRHEGRMLDDVASTFPILRERLMQRAGSLSGGEQRMLAIARALMGEPRLLLVDEASMGLSPAMVSITFGMLDRIRERGVGILMAEQNVGAIDIADRAYVLEKGRIVRHDEGEALSGTRTALAGTYLGGAAAGYAGVGR